MRKLLGVMCICMIVMGVSCTHKMGTGNGGSSLLVCEYADLSGKEKELRLSDFVEDCRVVRFENVDNAYFKGSIVATENYLFVRQGRGNPCKLFDKEGHFLCDVGSVGNGPGEYYQPIYDVAVDESGKRIFLAPFTDTKIMVYGMDGKWIKDIPVPIEGRINKPKIRLNEDGTLTVVHMPMWTNPDSPLAFCMDMDGNLVKQVSVREDMQVRNFDGEVLADHNTGQMEFQHTTFGFPPRASNDTLFSYDATTNRLSPKFVLNFPDPEKSPVHYYVSIPQGIFVKCYGLDERTNKFVEFEYYFIDRKTGKGGRFHMVNDFYGDLPIASAMDFFQQGYYVECFEPYELLEKIEEHLSSGDCPKGEVEKLKALSASLHEEDNNVLFIGKLKQP